MDSQDPAPSAPSTFGPLVWGWPCQPIVSQSHSSQTDEAPGSSEGLALDDAAAKANASNRYNVVLDELGRVREQRDSTLAKLEEMARDRSNYDRHIQELDGMLRRQMDEAAAESRRLKQMVVCADRSRAHVIRMHVRLTTWLWRGAGYSNAQRGAAEGGAHPPAPPALCGMFSESRQGRAGHALISSLHPSARVLQVQQQAREWAW